VTYRSDENDPFAEIKQATNLETGCHLIRSAHLI
jgi:hypothetical protein